MGKYYLAYNPKQPVKQAKPKRKQDPKDRQYHQYERLAETACRFGVTERDMSAFCFVNGVHMRSAGDAVEVDRTDLYNLLERVGIKPGATVKELRDEQKLFFTNTVNIR